MGQRGRPRKIGARERNGRLCRSPAAADKGHELTLVHRASILAGGDPHDPRASECLGILYLRGDLADPGQEPDAAAEQGHLRYLAGIRYGRDHAVVWNGRPGRPNPSPGSPLRAFLPDDRGSPPNFDCDDADAETNYRRRERHLRKATARLIVLGPYPLFVLDDVVVYLHRMRCMDEDRQPPYLLPAERATIAALRMALRALVIEYR